jgi:hypothetical protein
MFTKINTKGKMSKTLKISLRGRMGGLRNVHLSEEQRKLHLDKFANNFPEDVEAQYSASIKTMQTFNFLPFSRQLLNI